jgi:stress-induced morphogen
MVATIESVRSQLQALQEQVAPNPALADVRAANDSIEQRFTDLEGRIIDLRMTGRGQDGVRWPVRLAGQLDYLATTIASSDFAPATQHREVYSVLAKETRDVHAALQTLMLELARHNAFLRSRSVKTVEVPPPTP